MGSFEAFLQGYVHERWLTDSVKQQVQYSGNCACSTLFKHLCSTHGMFKCTSAVTKVLNGSPPRKVVNWGRHVLWGSFQVLSGQTRLWHLPLHEGQCLNDDRHSPEPSEREISTSKKCDGGCPGRIRGLQIYPNDPQVHIQTAHWNNTRHRTQQAFANISHWNPNPPPSGSLNQCWFLSML